MPKITQDTILAEILEYPEAEKTPHQKLRFGAGLVQHRASLWCWVLAK